jgi:hypothetical protein
MELYLHIYIYPYDVLLNGAREMTLDVMAM